MERAITVEQRQNENYDLSKRAYVYQVIDAVNTTAPKLGEIITEEQINLIIVGGTNVAIRRRES